jgi:hypothetical protein
MVCAEAASGEDALTVVSAENVTLVAHPFCLTKKDAKSQGCTSSGWGYTSVG